MIDLSYDDFRFFPRSYVICDRQDVIDDGKCSFIIHKECAYSKNTPRHIPHHPFHPQHHLALSSGHHLSSDQAICNACGDDLKTCFVYKCSTPHCSFALDVKCAFLTLTNISNQGRDLQLPSHPHPLILCDKGENWIDFVKENFSYSCTCCKFPIIDDDRTLLVCLECKALLHKSCAEIPWNIEKHPFHPSHPLVLLPRIPNPGPCFKCHLCRQKKQDGFAYHCPECGIFLDVRCASLKPKRNNADDNHDVQQLKHFHPLIVCEDEQNAFSRTGYSCGVCGHPSGDGVEMYSFLQREEDKMYFGHECECLLDQSCADHSGQDIEHVLHPEHKLTR
ncbi:hypothetical protein Vadar_031987 [Vaccinium darrowii]|uniref:Uncharacterized protein n=1 Tax=Vaccinium darrowii TaxID=229202 RepID=A0ACB7YSA1_9ERIC|nr:hypothetical protein Vadar_031987 [Vaccinium darrowii]